MGPVFGVMRLTFLECRRKRAFLVLFCVVFAFVAGSILLPATKPSDRLYLVIAWALRAIGFFGMLVTVFVTAVSIPDDIEDRRVFTLRAKPLNTLQWCGGKMLGFAAVIALFVAASGAISLAYIRLVAVVAGTDETTSRLIAARGRVAPVAMSYATSDAHGTSWGVVEGDGLDGAGLRCRLAGESRSHQFFWQFGFLFSYPVGDTLRLGYRFKAASPDNKPVTLQFRFVAPETKLEARDVAEVLGEATGSVSCRRELIDPNGATQVYVRRTDSASTLEGGPLDLWVETTDGRRVTALQFQHGGDQEPAYVVASWTPERGTLVRLHGPEGGSLTWHFRGMDRSELPGRELDIPFRLRVGGRGYAAYTDALLEVRRPGSDDVEREIRRLKYGVPGTLQVRPGLVSPDGDCDITLRRRYPNSYAEVQVGDVAFLTRPRLFEVNFIKALCLMYCQLTLVMTVTVMGSTCLSAPVSLFWGGFSWLCASMMAFLREAQSTVEATLRHAAAETAGVLPTAVHSHDPTEIPTWMLQFSQNVVDLLLRIVPDFDRFDPAPALLKGSILTWSQVGAAVELLALWAGISFVVGCLILWRREFN
ncbi:MAG: hypothetical protein HYY93_15950 [Planctomycetes bacterium]|nr:hypothetical protein [Planctomycetota bacterium]